jgi:3-methyladenine DNA glycosylase AlkD
MSARGTKSEKPGRTEAELKADATAAVAALKRASSKMVRDGMVRFGIPTTNALGVQMKDIQSLGKKLGLDHELAEALWETGIYEARLLVAYVADPAELTVAQMEKWCRDFDNWGVTDTLCFALFVDSPLAWGRVRPWVRRKAEFEKRAGFVMIACLARPKRPGEDALFLECLQMIEDASTDERNFVKKGVNWALRGIGRRNKALNAASVALSRRLIESESTAARWIGRDALRELTSAAVVKGLKD